MCVVRTGEGKQESLGGRDKGMCRHVCKCMGPCSLQETVLGLDTHVWILVSLSKEETLAGVKDGCQRSTAFCNISMSF